MIWWTVAVLAALIIGWEAAEALRRRQRDKQAAAVKRIVRRMRGK